jgi:catecholate siderophore receptor
VDKTGLRQRKRKQDGHRGQNSWPVAYRLAALGTLVAYSAIGSKTINVVCAHELSGASKASGRATQTRGAVPELAFDIQPGPLGPVLAAFEAATGLHASVVKSGMLSLASPGVSGTCTAEQALQRLLKDTGINYRFTSSTAFTLELNAVASSTDVTTTIEALSTASPKFADPLVDNPQTITTVSQELMQQQAATTLRDALRNVAGISLAAGEGGAQGDNLTIRGFTARNDLFIDGMRDFGSYYRDPFNTQEVEVLQGASSVTFGRGSTGGVVNQTSKTPRLDPAISGGLDFGTDLTHRMTLDINEPLTLFGSGAAFRLNVMGDAGNVAGRDVAENRRYGVAPSLALGLGTSTRWIFSYVHQAADDIPDYGIPWLFNGPAPVDRDNYYGFENANHLRTYVDIGTVKTEHDVNGNIMIRNQVRYANYVRDVLITEPQIPSNVNLTTPLDTINVTRHEIGVDSVETYLDEQFDVQAYFETGSLRHTLVSGIELGRETSDPTRPTWTNVPSTSLLDPNPSQPFSGTSTITSIVHTTAISSAAYALDTIALGNKWDITGGIRWDRMDADYRQSVAPAAAFDRVDEMPSWRAALVYKPVQMCSVYVAAGTSFNPSAESLSLSASNASLPPEKNRSYEFGSKWDIPRNKLSLRAAMFRTEKLNAREPDPLNPVLNVLAGNQRVDGVEAEVKGQITSRWDILSSYAHLNGRVVSSDFYPLSVGARLANVPANTFNFWTNFHFPRRWDTGFGGNFVSSRTASSTVPLDPVTGLVKQVSGYWVFNAMVSHPLAEHLDLQLNLVNIANRYYYDELHPAHIVLGPGRSASIGLRFRF